MMPYAGGRPASAVHPLGQGHASSLPESAVQHPIEWMPIEPIGHDMVENGDKSPYIGIVLILDSLETVTL